MGQGVQGRGDAARVARAGGALAATPLLASCSLTLELGHASVELMSGLLGVVVWVVANLAYLDFKRYGERGFKRFLGFWLGLPGTLATALLVPEGRPQVEPPDDQEDVDRLLAEWRGGRGSGEIPAGAARPHPPDGEELR